VRVIQHCCDIDEQSNVIRKLVPKRFHALKQFAMPEKTVEIFAAIVRQPIA
jgi:hypothetical protein